MSESKEISISNLLLSDKTVNELAKYFKGDRNVALYVQRVAITEIKKNPKISECEPLSVIGAIFQSAQMGLSLDSNLQYAALIPYGNKCQLQPMYRGMLKMIYRTGKVVKANAYVVKENDLFEYENIDGNESLRFKLKMNDRGNIIGAFSVIEFTNGSKSITTMDMHDINQCKIKSKSSNVWQNHMEEMCKKTVIKRACKYLDIDDGLSRAIYLDDMTEEMIDQKNDCYDSDVDFIPNKKTKSDQIRSVISEDSEVVESRPYITETVLL